MSPAQLRPLDEDDVALVDALHVNPRATFEQLGPALGVSAVTVARRWRRLTESGRVWISSAPGPAMPFCGALFEARCSPGSAPRVAAALAEIPQVYSVHMVTGRSDLYALVAAADSGLLSRLLIDEMPSVPGLLSVRSSVVTEMFGGWRWRLGAISADQAGAVGAGRPQQDGARGFRPVDEFERDLYMALQTDGRAAYRDLAEVLGRSEQSVQRRMTSLIATGRLVLRTDFVRGQAGWPVQLPMWLEVPEAEIAAVAVNVAGWPETRVCVSLASRPNLFVTVQLHGLSDLEPVLARLTARWPSVRVVDHEVVLRTVKSWGRLLDVDGRAFRTIPVDLWADV